MLIRSALMLMACVLLAGCTSVQIFDLGNATDATFDELNAKAQRQEARMTLAGYPPQTVMEVEVRVDTTFWIDPRTGHPRAIPTALISEIRFRKNQFLRGAVAGAGFGAASAMVVGEDCSDVPEIEVCYGRFDLMPITALAGGLFGGVIGSRGSERFLFIAPLE